MKTPYDFSKLVKQVHTQTAEKLTEKEVEELLLINEDAYQKDSPISVGKSLVIKSLEFLGTKQLDGTEKPIHYKRLFPSGVNLWVGDNFVGKSSIFKIIKLALTGNKKISRDIEKWLSDIWLEFRLGHKVYSAHIDRDKQNRFRFALFNSGRTDLVVASEEQSETCLFDGGIGKYEEFMQGFFFRELAYYSLQWTQHDSRPEVLELRTAAASWSTYYKSVYLEADDYNFLFFGGQAELIFQMLLGLELTYPINRLAIKRKHLANKLSMLKMASSTVDQDPNKAQRLVDEQKLAQLITELSALDQAFKQATVPPSQSIEQQVELVRQKYRNALSKRGELERENDALNDQVVALVRQVNSLARQIDEYEVDIKKKKRRISDLQELLDIGSFFNGLEVRTCPNCNHRVDSQKVQHEKSTGSCRLCEHEVDQEPVDKEAYNSQIQILESQRQAFFNDQYVKKVEQAHIQDSINTVNYRIREINKEVINLRIDDLYQELYRLQAEMITLKPKPFDVAAHFDKVTNLSVQKALLEQRLQKEITPVSPSTAEQALIEVQIQAIELAEALLQQERTERSQSLIHTFESLYLKQLHAFGLPQYERVEVKPNFRVVYYKQGEEYNFDEITTGEQLRAKLGLYIALIELDVEHQLGRHPRFLVLDSPAKEEGDQTYVEGLKTTLSYIQDHFGQDMQVFVGTAQRELASAVDSDQVEVRGTKEYFF